MKAQFESPKYLHQAKFETLKHPKHLTHLGYNVKHVLKQNITISLGHFIFSKNSKQLLKTAQCVTK
jgi:hypothetical protein